eukprot:COSAG02_NODE_577_length_20095_cov_6.816413_13_plen_87_part_00
MLPRAVSEWASAASRELYSILPKVYDINQTNIAVEKLKLAPRSLVGRVRVYGASGGFADSEVRSQRLGAGRCFVRIERVINHLYYY